MGSPRNERVRAASRPCGADPIEPEMVRCPVETGGSREGERYDFK